ncbi:MAG: response regulator transcription factor [Cyclobacteriaceae bacterium]|nr:response regulator transcription factor [Cyclobacteriaceae bacterium]
MTHIVIAEDQLVFSEALTALLAGVEGIEIVKSVENGQVLLDFLTTEKVDLVLMDIKMPVLDGIKATNLIKEKYPSIKVLILSFHIKEIDVLNAMESGADGYLSKNTNKIEILEAISCLKEGKPYYSQEVVRVLSNIHSLSRNKDIIKLSARESEILELLTKGFSSKQIGKQIDLAESTIKTYRNGLLEKFKANNSADLTRKVMEGGYL